MAVDGLFALAVPPMTNPGTVTLPKLPGGISPGSIVITLLAGLGSYLQTQPLPQPDPIERAKKIAEELKEDNKNVVKMSDVANEINKKLNSKLIAGLVYRAIVNTLRPGTKGSFVDIGTAVSDAEWDPIREELKAAIREHILQQKNPRKSVETKSYERLGKLHATA